MQIYDVANLNVLRRFLELHYIAVIYRQPDDPAGGHRSTDVEFKQAIAKLDQSLTKLPNPAPNTIFCGDFNPYNTHPGPIAHPRQDRHL